MLSIDVRKEFLNKDACIDEARRIISEGKIKNMSELQLAREIYFHALAFYFCDKTGWLPSVRSHATPIDMKDGGDNILRKTVFAASWLITKKKK